MTSHDQHQAEQKNPDLDEGHLITLVTGIWAQAQNEKPHPHRAEVEASLISNLDNRYIHQLLVILDSVSEDTQDCHQFTDRLISLGWQSRHPSHLSCIERAEGQPTYYEMFRYTLHPNVEGLVVVLSNADQVFDDTLRYAKHIPANMLWTLSTRGFSSYSAGGSSRLHETYHRIATNGVAVSTYTRGYCADDQPYSLSWDTYIFQPETIRRSLRASNFLRPNFYRKLIPFFMNELGAENAALHGLSLGLVNMTYWNACHLISSWHFHLAHKMHKTNLDTANWPLVKDGRSHYDDGTDSPDNKPGEFVPGPYAFIPTCNGAEQCFSTYQGMNPFYYAKRPS
jgi:hypothetical protein